ncbi:flavin reductase family protein [Paenarthrobacter nitroguajacolicus]|uniref:flavin reductase family protein n=1 Tax=Paenarthrobacter nitroguajacolicus TaxID=211146 RepID=UPI000A626C48|nr:flavin reductase family protein [Paenarthrobacter nitroguajacolicus]
MDEADQGQDDQLVISPEAVKASFGHHASSIVLVAAQIGEEPVGFVASSFTTVSWEPPLISFCVQKESRTWQRLKSVPYVGVSILSQSHEAMTHQLASRNLNRFEGVPIAVSQGRSCVLIQDAPASFECTIDTTIDAGDHFIVLLRVHSAESRDGEPLIYHRSSLRKMVTAG